MLAILSVGIRYEQEVVIARQYARTVAGLLGFDVQQQTRLATAVSEIARNAFQYAGGGRVEFALEGETAPQVLLVRVSDRGPGISNLSRILEENYTSRTGMGLGIVGARRLLDRFEIQSEPGRGTTVWMRKLLPRRVRPFSRADLAALSAKITSGEPQNLLEDLRQQNGELMRTLDELRLRQEELAQLNRELEDTNRGVVALYAELDELLDLAKVAAGKIVIRPAEFDVASLFGALRGMLRPLLLNTSVNLVFEEPEKLPTLETDEAKISQILRNFISNALKFTEKGEVRVSARLAPGGGNVIFSVADTGIGIAPADHATIFQEFAQIENPLQRKVKGRGLGLPLSKKPAELLGGTITVESAPGVGSTFSLTVPLVYAGAEVTGDVLFAPEIVLDLLMPDLSGFQVLEQLQADARTSHIPVIVSTSRLLDDADRARLAKSAAKVLPKSAFSDGSAAALLHGICGEIGLAEIWGAQTAAAAEGLLK